MTQRPATERAELAGNLFRLVEPKSEKSRLRFQRISLEEKKEILGIPGGQWTSMLGTVRRKCVIGIPARPFLAYVGKGRILVSGRAGRVWS